MAGFAPEGTEFDEIRGSWKCPFDGMIASDPEFCDYCGFPRFNPPDEYAPLPGMVTIETDPTPDPIGVEPGHSDGIL